MLEALQDRLAPALGDDGCVLLVNHVLTSEPAAMQRLAPHAGPMIALELAAWPSLLPAPPALRLSRHAAGPARMVWPASAACRDLRCSSMHRIPPLLCTRSLAGEPPPLTIGGDAALATDVNWLIDNLRWDVEADLERLFGEWSGARSSPAWARLARRRALRALAQRTRADLAQRAAPRRDAATPRPHEASRAALFIVLTVLRFGLDEIALSGFPQRWVRCAGARRHASAAASTRRAACACAMALERLGPDLRQVRPGAVDAARPAAARRRRASWRSCRTACRRFPARMRVAIVERAFGAPIDAIFASFDAAPVASASIAQVHFAMLKDGREVAVKVLRPGMLAAIDDDLALLHRWPAGSSAGPRTASA